MVRGHGLVGVPPFVSWAGAADEQAVGHDTVMSIKPDRLTVLFDDAGYQALRNGPSGIRVVSR